MIKSSTRTRSDGYDRDVWTGVWGTNVPWVVGHNEYTLPALPKIPLDRYPHLNRYGWLILRALHSGEPYFEVTIFDHEARTFEDHYSESIAVDPSDHTSTQEKLTVVAHVLLKRLEEGTGSRD